MTPDLPPACLAEIAAERELYNRAEEHSSALATKMKGYFSLVHSRQLTILPNKFADGTPIPMAELRWDKEARGLDGEWNLDHVIRSTRFECPHCHGHIRDHHRPWLDKHGRWLATRQAMRHRGYHLSSYYAPHAANGTDFESSWGGMAKKFLDAHATGKLRDLINLDWAEVHVSQELIRTEIISAGNLATEDWTPLMTCDFQKNWPYIWYVIAKWSSFKLHPPFPITNGKPNFAEHLKQNPALQIQCEKIVGTVEAAWFPLAEILRFDPRTGAFPMLDFIIAQNITGEKLVQLWRDHCQMDTLSLGRHIYREIGQRMPKGGDSEIIAAGHCELSGDDAWTELIDLQAQYKVGQPLRKFGIHPNRALLIDSGYAEKNNPEVLRKCYEIGVDVWLKCAHCNPSNGPQRYGSCCWEWYDPVAKKFSPHRLHDFMRPVPKNSWMPYRGRPTIRPNKDLQGIETYKKWIPGDPFSGLREAEKKAIRVLEAASEHYFTKWMEKRGKQKEIHAQIAAGRSYRGNIWNISDKCQFTGRLCANREAFEKQMNTKGIDDEGKIWQRGTGGNISRKYPDHLNDCAGHMMESLAETLGFFSYERTAPANPQNQPK